MKLEKILEAAAGAYLVLIGPEDVATAGTTAIPSAVVGVALIADAFGVKL